jgi:hypothetical protein
MTTKARPEAEATLRHPLLLPHLPRMEHLLLQQLLMTTHMAALRIPHQCPHTTQMDLLSLVVTASRWRRSAKS